jgi:hypothetical protein
MGSAGIFLLEPVIELSTESLQKKRGWSSHPRPFKHNGNINLVESDITLWKYQSFFLALDSAGNSAVAGLIIFLTSMISFAGKPPLVACSRIASSFSAL